MTRRMLMAWWGCGLAAIVATAGCSGDASPAAGGTTGGMTLMLDLTGEATIDEVWYRITGNDMPEMTGFIDTSAPGATASVEVFGLAPGLGYLVELRAIADDGTSCSGIAPFDVRAGIATEVSVMINCKPPERFGSVRVNGKLNVCAHLEKVIASPLQTSVGARIDLSARGVDAENDRVAYSWSSSGGPIVAPSEPITELVCAVPGRHVVQIAVSDDGFNACVDTWTIEVTCVSDGGGAGGGGGAPGLCLPQAGQCMNGDIDPIVEDPSCVLATPPSLPNTCFGDESLVNPSTCSLTDVGVKYDIQSISVAGNCNVGFDLDRCDGTTCNEGGLAPREGLDGVDNALAGLAPILAGVGGNLGGLNQALYDGLCNGTIDWALVIGANVAENCATVIPLYDGVASAPVILNLSDTGCLSGKLGEVPLAVAGVPGSIANATLLGTADSVRGLDVIVGGTADSSTAVAIAEALLEGAGAVVSQVFDINDDLQADTQSCNALSLTFDVGAVAGEPGTGGTGGSGGTGGTGGSGGGPPACISTGTSCSNGPIDPIVEDPTCTLNEPPDLPNACMGSESVLNPASCTATGVTSLHAVQALMTAGDCNVGFDLDACVGNTCMQGGLTPGEGLDGIDNALAGLAPVFAGVGANLGGLDQAFYESLCTGNVDWKFLVDPNPAESCVTVTPIYDGVQGPPIPMNLSDRGCLSGTLGTMPLSIAGVAGALFNGTVRGTVDPAQGFNFLLGATAEGEGAAIVADQILPGAGAIVNQVLDINSNLEPDNAAACDSLSATLQVGGTRVEDIADGACTSASDGAVYEQLSYTDGSGALRVGDAAASAIASDCIFGSFTSDPTVSGCPSEAQAALICFPTGCPPATIAALAECTTSCTQDVIAEVTGSRLTADCADCYGDSVACRVALCATSGCSNPSSPSCVACQCENDCIPAFDRCSGLPPTGQCQ